MAIHWTSVTVLAAAFVLAACDDDPIRADAAPAPDRVVADAGLEAGAPADAPPGPDGSEADAPGPMDAAGDGGEELDAQPPVDAPIHPDAQAEDGAEPGDAAIPLSVEGALAEACAFGRCRASALIAYWKDDWRQYATERTVRLTEVSPTEHAMEVTDASGMPAVLTFEAGRPVTLTIVNPGDARSGGEHFFTAPRFFRSVAWRKVETASAEYKAPYFDAVAVQRTSGTDRSIRLFFVPLIAGMFDAYCEAGVTGGSSYADIAAMRVEPDLGTGHAGLGGRTVITVLDDLQVRLDPELYPGWRRPLEVDSRRASSDPVWADGARDDTYRTMPIRMVEMPMFRLSYDPSTVTLTRGRGAVIGIENPAGNEGPHYVTSPAFFTTAILQHAGDVHARVYAPYLNGVEALVGGSAELWLVPTASGSFTPYCSIGVFAHPDGWPVLTTGHAGLGMSMNLTVIDP